LTKKTERSYRLNHTATKDKLPHQTTKTQHDAKTVDISKKKAERTEKLNHTFTKANFPPEQRKTQQNDRTPGISEKTGFTEKLNRINAKVNLPYKQRKKEEINETAEISNKKTERSQKISQIATKAEDATKRGLLSTKLRSLSDRRQNKSKALTSSIVLPGSNPIIPLRSRKINDSGSKHSSKR